MKKILIGLLIAGMLVVLLGSVVGASFSQEQCERCCYLYNVTKWYRVSYFDAEHNWVTERIGAWTAREAAEKLDLRAGYDCFVGYEGTDFEPILKSYKVSHFVGGNWTVDYVEAKSAEDAAESLGLRAGYDCFVNRVF